MTGACLSLSLFLSLSLSGVNPFIVDEAFFISILHIHISVWPPSQRVSFSASGAESRRTALVRCARDVRKKGVHNPQYIIGIIARMFWFFIFILQWVPRRNRPFALPRRRTIVSVPCCSVDYSLEAQAKSSLARRHRLSAWFLRLRAWQLLRRRGYLQWFRES